MWKKIIIDNVETNYSISDKGEVRNDIRGTLLKLAEQNGYKHVTLSISTRPKRCRVHRLVAETFIPNPDNKPYVNHKDGNRINNEVKNLEWVTPSENTQHAVRTGLLKGNNMRKVIQYGVNGERIQEYNSLTEAANAIGTKPEKISEVCQGKRKSSGRFQWRYSSDNIKKLSPIEITNIKQDIAQIDPKTNEIIAIYRSMGEAAKAVNGTQSAISRICNGTPGLHTHKGYKWKKVDDMIQ